MLRCRNQDEMSILSLKKCWEFSLLTNCTHPSNVSKRFRQKHKQHTSIIKIGFLSSETWLDCWVFVFDLPNNTIVHFSVMICYFCCYCCCCCCSTLWSTHLYFSDPLRIWMCAAFSKTICDTGTTKLHTHSNTNWNYNLQISNRAWPYFCSFLLLAHISATNTIYADE